MYVHMVIICLLQPRNCYGMPVCTYIVTLHCQAYSLTNVYNIHNHTKYVIPRVNNRSLLLFTLGNTHACIRTYMCMHINYNVYAM